MRDLTTFLTELYVIIDDWSTTQPPPPPQPGPAAKLNRSEVLTLAVVGQWGRFASERAFWRWAQRQLQPFFPSLPSRVQFNRAQRRLAADLAQLAVWLGQQWGDDPPAFEILDASGLATRESQRRGRGWLAGIAAIGQCTRLGWYEGVRLLICSTPRGAITGFGLAPANTNDRPLAETFLATRCHADPRLPGIGTAATDIYVADKGFAGLSWETRWEQAYHAAVVCQPSKKERRAGRIWSRPERKAHASRRQIVETVFDRLLNTFRLARERPHHLDGLRARVAAKIALHNACVLSNRTDGDPLLAFAAFLDW